MEFLGSSTEYLESGVVTKAEVLAKYSNAAYITVAVKHKEEQHLALADLIKASGLSVRADLSHTGRITHDTVMQVQKSQDGAIYKDTLFLFNAAGKCTVFNIDSKQKIGSFTLDKNAALSPHANSVCFSDVFYAEGDPFPVLYVNIYNNYWTTNDRKEGMCCAYRILEENGSYSTKLVQVLKIGFTNDYDLWNSAEGNGYHYYLPYGNFVVDVENGKYCAYVMRSEELGTRYFVFDLPKLQDGEIDEKYGVKRVVLTPNDIEKQFDCPEHHYIQGACCHAGKVYSVEGFRNNPALRIVDLNKGEQELFFNFSDVGVTDEAEFIDFYCGSCYYGDCHGNIYLIEA
jgi:hypothetical protein